jgi:hypothetical protein
MLISEFVEKVYLPEYVMKNSRAATLKQYRDVWEDHLKHRLTKLTPRETEVRNVNKSLEPRVGVERTTCRLRNELFWCISLLLRIRHYPPFAIFRPHSLG